MENKQKYITVADYIASSRMTHQELADLIPCTRNYITMICNGKAKPGFKMARRIEQVTYGIVKKEQWFETDASLEYKEYKGNTDE